MAEIKSVLESEKFEPPSGKVSGRILVEVLGRGATGVYRWETNVLDYDSESAVFWINEGIGFEYFFDSIGFPGEGFWVVTNITITWIRHTDWGSDDEEIKHGEIRPATTEEIKTKTLS